MIKFFRVRDGVQVRLLEFSDLPEPKSAERERWPRVLPFDVLEPEMPGSDRRMLARRLRLEVAKEAAERASSYRLA